MHFLCSEIIFNILTSFDNNDYKFTLTMNMLNVKVHNVHYVMARLNCISVQALCLFNLNRSINTITRSLYPCRFPESVPGGPRPEGRRGVQPDHAPGGCPRDGHARLRQPCQRHHGQLPVVCPGQVSRVSTLST